MQQDTFYPHKNYEQVSFYEQSRIFIVGGSVQIRKDPLTFDWLTNATFQPKVDKNYFFMKKEIENFEFDQTVILEFEDSLKKKGTKYLLILKNSSEEIWNSKAFCNVATAGRNRGLSTMYINHTLFHQGKLGRDVELQNMHIVLSKSPCNVM